jgi:hypothetical protein
MLRALAIYAKALSMRKQTATVVDSQKDFSQHQGFNNLFYVRGAAADFGGAAGSAARRGGGGREWSMLSCDLPFWASDKDDFWYTESSESPLAASKTMMHPSAEQDVAKLWRSHVAERVHIAGEVAKTDLGGDGVEFSVTVGNETRFHRFVSLKRPFKFELSAELQIGTEVAFIAHAGVSHNDDSLWTYFVVERELRSVEPGEEMEAAAGRGGRRRALGWGLGRGEH